MKVQVTSSLIQHLAEKVHELHTHHNVSLPDVRVLIREVIANEVLKQTQHVVNQIRSL